MSSDCNQHPHLGLASTRELLNEVSARIEVDYITGIPGGLDYTTVDAEKKETVPMKKKTLTCTLRDHIAFGLVCYALGFVLGLVLGLDVRDNATP